MNEHILRLAREHAPCYLYFYETLAAQATALHDAFPGFGVLFSVKANPFPPVMRVLAARFKWNLPRAKGDEENAG